MPVRSILSVGIWEILYAPGAGAGQTPGQSRMAVHSCGAAWQAAGQLPAQAWSGPCSLPIAFLQPQQALPPSREVFSECVQESGGAEQLNAGAGGEGGEGGFGPFGKAGSGRPSTRRTILPMARMWGADLQGAHNPR